MIFENTGLDGLKSDLAYLDESAEKVGFVRWQWEYYRATYDYKIEDDNTNSEYFVRINTRVVDGKLENQIPCSLSRLFTLAKQPFRTVSIMTLPFRSQS